MDLRLPATATAALKRPRLLTAVILLIAAGLLRRYEIPPVPTWFYVLAWYPTLVILDEVVVLLGGESLTNSRRDVALMLWTSVVIWLGFEAINLRLQNWYYVFLPAGRLERWAGITISIATVVPAVLLPERVLDRLGAWRDLRSHPVPLELRHLLIAWWTGWVLVGAVLLFPRYLFPLTWGAVWLIAEPLLYRRDPERSLFASLARGSWGRIARLLAAGLAAGILWETFNAMARGRWIYTVPFLEDWKLFEMPLLGFLGFPFFALEVWSLYHLLAPLATRRTLLASMGLALLVLAGIDQWTVSSTTPALRDLPGVTNAVIWKFEAGGWNDLFRIARSPVAELAYRANLSPEDAVAAQAAARLVTLRGIGTAHAAALIGAGFRSVDELAQADPDSVWRAVGGGRARGPRGAHPTLAEIRVWVRAAQRRAER